jgi:hypothetical protein
VTEISIADLFEVLSKRLDYIGVESAPPGVSVPGDSLYSSFTLDDLRDVVASSQYGTTIEELVADIEDYPIELHQLLMRWVGGRRISFDCDRDMVKLA